MHLEICILREVSERERQIPYDITYMGKYSTNEPIYKTETDSYRTDLWLPGGREEEGVEWTGSLGLIYANYYI